MKLSLPVKALSRRSLLQAVACAAGIVPILGATFAPRRANAQMKVPKSVVQYQDHPKGNQRCDNCALFEPPNACRSVAGRISPRGWCTIWAPK